MSYSTQRLLSAQLWLPGRASEPTPLDPLALADLAGQTVRLEETRVFLRDSGAKRTARFRKQLRRLVARRETLQAAGCDPDAPGSAAPDMSLRQLRQLPRAFGRKVCFAWQGG